MKKNILLGLIAVIFLTIVSFVIFFYLKTQKQDVQKKAEGEYKSLYFIAADGSYEAILSYKFEYPKFIWKFDKLTCASNKALVQRRFLHIGKTADEVVRDGWIDQSFFQWSPGEVLPSGEVNIPVDKGCYFQLDATMTIKPINEQTADEINAINSSDGGKISGCGTIQPSLTPTPTLTPTPPVQPSPTPTSPTATITVLPSATPTPTTGPSPTASITPQNTPANSPTPTTIVPTNVAPTNIVPTNQPTPTNIQLPEAGIKVPTLGGIIAGFLLISLGLVLAF